jgi:hypothetical protein
MSYKIDLFVEHVAKMVGLREWQNNLVYQN